MSSVSVRAPSPRRAPPVRDVAVVLVAAIAAGLMIWLIAGWLEGPTRVDLVIENPTPYPLLLRVRSAGETSVLPVGYTSKNSTSAFEDVIDQGDTWVFEFSYAGVDLPSLERSRAELEAAEWRVAVPANTSSHLQRAGREPPP